MSAQRVGLLFPGQGAQALGMGRALYERAPAAKRIFDRASELLGYDLPDLCFNGPESKLHATEFCQPALFVSSIAAYEVLREERPEVVGSVTAVAGLSLGEYTAVCVAKVLPFEEALLLVQKRGQAMQSAADQVASGMMSVLGLETEKVAALCDQVRQAGEVLQVANLLCPGNIVVSGHKSALARLEPVAVAAGSMKVIPLTVAGAFHTPLMQPAVEALTAALAAKSMTTAQIPVYSNVDAAPHTSAEEIRSLLARQVVSPVLWEASLRRMLSDGCQVFYEVGTGKVLRGTLKRIDRKAAAEGFGDE